VFYKLYPRRRQYQLIFGRNDKFGQFMRRIRDYAQFLSARLILLDTAWVTRWQHANTLPHMFDANVRTCVDTFPVYTQRPKDNSWFRALYNGKYKSCVVKFQLYTDHRGSPIFFTGPHVGVRHDVVLFQQHTPVFMPHETVLGDKGYVGGGARIIVPIKKPVGRVLTREQKAFNSMHSWYRATVEHAIAYLKRFGILACVYRGRIELASRDLFQAMKIICVLSYMNTALFPMRIHSDLLMSDSETTDSDSVSDSESDVGDDVLPFGAVERQEAPVKSGHFFTDFRVGDDVEAWHGTYWWRATITDALRRSTDFTIQWALDGTKTYQYKPWHMRPIH